MHLISIVICTYNRSFYLPKCFDHLLAQNASPDSFEIIIINNDSTDNTEEISKSFIENNPEYNITYAVEKKSGLSNARNKGIEISSGELIAFIDDDGFARNNYVTELLNILNHNLHLDYISFGGKVEPIYTSKNKPIWISKYIEGVVSRVDLGDEIKPFYKKYPAGCNMVFRKEFFENYGGFNVDLHTRGDDKFVFDNLKKNKLKILYLPNLYVEHFIDDYRLEKSFIIKLSKIIGQSEQIRLKRYNTAIRINKFLEYIFKLFAAFVIALFYIFQLQYQKAQYLILVRWNVLKGFFIKSKI